MIYAAASVTTILPSNQFLECSYSNINFLETTININKWHSTVSYKERYGPYLSKNVITSTPGRIPGAVSVSA